MAANEYDNLIKSTFQNEAPIDEGVAQIKQEETKQLKQSMFAASQKNPDQYANALKLSNELKLPVDIVERNYDMFSKQKVQKQTDYEKLMTDSPGLTKWLKDPSNSALGSDDIDGLSAVDSAASKLKKNDTYFIEDLAQAGQTGWNDSAASMWHLGMAVGTAEQSDENFEAIAEFNRRSSELRSKAPEYSKEFNNVMAEEGQDVQKSFSRFLGSYKKAKDGQILDALKDFGAGGGKTVGESLDLIGKSIIRPKALLYSATQSLANSQLPLALGGTGAIVGGTAGTVALPVIGTVSGAGVGYIGGSFAGSVMSEYGSWINQAIQEKGYDIQNAADLKRAYSDKELMADIRVEAMRKGIVTGAVDAIFNKFSGKFLKNAKPGIAGKVVSTGKELVVQGVGEGASEFAGQVAAKKSVEKASLAEALQEGITSFGHSMGELAITAPAEVRGLFKKDTVQATQQVAEQAQGAAKAFQDAQALSDVADAVNATKTMQRSPEAIQNLIDVATGETGTSKVFFQTKEWDDYWNVKGVNPQEAAANILGDDGLAYVEARKNGGFLQVDLGQYVSKMSQSPEFDGLLNITRTSEESISLGEAKEFLKNLPGVMGSLSEEAKNYQNMDDGDENVAKQTVKDQLLAAGYKEDIADKNAQVWGSMFKVLADSTGQDINVLMETFKPQITRSDVSDLPAGSLNQSPLELLKERQEKEKEFIDFIKSKGKVAVKNQIIPPGMLRELGAPQDMIDRLVEFNKPEWQYTGPSKVPAGKKPLFQKVEIAPAFYNTSEKIIQEKMGNTATVEQVNGILRDLKPEERKWLGIDEFLKGKEKVSKSELLAHIQANNLQIEETYLSDTATAPVKDLPSYELFTEQALDKGYQLDEIEELANDVVSGTLGLNNQVPEISEKLRDEFVKRTGIAMQKTLYSQYQLPGEKQNYKELLFKLPKVKDEYEAPHFGEEGRNLLAHTRINERTDSEGKRVLMVEEIQSDLHQEGRKKGYKGEAKTKPVFWLTRDGIRLNSYNSEATAQKDLLFFQKSKEAANVGKNFTIETEQVPVSDFGAVTDAPFKKTWHEFVMKRLVRYAAENGFDKVAWTTGEQQAERYDLSKQVDSVTALKNSRGSYNVFAMKDSLTVAEQRDAKESDLEGLIGKELAAKIIKDSEDGEEHTYSGVDLKVGGEGMKGFYDKILVDYAKKLGKKFGATVGESKLDKQGRLKELLGKQDEGLTPPEWSELEKLQSDSSSITVHSLEITPALRDVALNQGFPLFQKKEEAVRGAYTLEEGLRRIMLFKDADLSTFLHESAHFFLEVYGDLVDSGQANDRVKNIYADILSQFGVESRDQITTDHHEEFARLFEAYAMEGKAPTEGLRSAFASFRAWLASIYKKISSLNVSINPEIRSVFDRMLATDEELQAAQEKLEMYPLFSDAKSFGMNEEEAAKYAKAIEDAKVAAREALDKKVLSHFQREKSKLWKEEKAKLQEQIMGEVMASPVFVARSVLTNGKNPDKTDANPAFEGLKLSRQAIVDQYGKEFVKKLPKMTSTEGLAPDLVAEMFGFSSGDEMITQMLNTPKVDDFINAKAEAILRDKYGDPMMSDEQFMKEAYEAAHSDKAAQVMRMEYDFMAKNNKAQLKGLSKKIALPLPTNDIVKDEAQKEVGSKKMRDLLPNSYARAEAKAARDAVEKFNRGDFEGAMEAKRLQLYNHELFRAASEAKQKAETQVDKLKGYLKLENRKRLGLAGQSYLDQVDSLLERFDFTRGVSLSEVDKRTKLADWIKTQQELGVEPVISEQLRNEAYKTSYKNMTIDELKGLSDAVENIAALARLKNRLLKSKRSRDLEEVLNEVVGSIEQNAKGGVRPKNYESRSKQVELQRLGAGFLANHRKLSSLLREFDGFKDGGSNWEYIMRLINDAGDEKAVRIEEATIEMNKIFDVYSRKERNNFEKKVFIPEINASLSKEAMLSLALNWGNLDSRQKAMDGYEWTEQQALAVLDKLEKKDWDFVQNIWDFINKSWPDVQALSQRVDGIAPDKVEAAKVRTKYGEYAGGYYPLKYDERQSPRQYANLAKEAAERAMKGAAVRATTQSGHRKERVTGVKMPIRLDLGVLFEHVDQVAHDLSHYEMLIDVNRIVGSSRFQKAVIDYHGDIVYGEIRAAIDDIAAGSVPTQKSMEKVLNRLRAGSAVASMGWNLATAMQQPLGLTQSIFRVGPKWIAIGLKRFIGDAARFENTAKVVHEKSDFMKLRHKTQQREIAEIRNTITDSKFKTDLYESFFWVMAKTQMFADIPTWIGEYEKSIEAGETEERASALADQAVIDSQGSGHIKDLSNIQRGSPIFKLWTAFYSYFNVTYNLNVEAFKRTNFQKVDSVGRLAADLFILNSLPALLTTLLMSGLKGEGDDPEKLAKKIAADQVSYLMGQMILVREIGSAMSGYNGYSGPAGTRFFSDAGKLMKQVEQGKMDEGLIRSLNQAGGVLFQYPATQVDRTVRGLDALSRGKTQNPAAVLFGPPSKK